MKKRPASWQTKVYKNLNKVIVESNAKVVLVDCLTVMITNLLIEVDLTWQNNLTAFMIYADCGIQRMPNAHLDSFKIAFFCKHCKIFIEKLVFKSLIIKII
ncbi:bifunctional adenosylcobinamide kinase/adenosylcobinamide-phosphate guanylyltransferase [Thermoanaerobacter sp. X514]|uniref:bifunctional adenosylcobinamide kinase/adenosylcobinamide-phosphate guanylyltransferase n=1 Tax=Thermoanaerobacter sp. (strain X514) TaxID=399726 RepID=UPI00351095D8